MGQILKKKIEFKTSAKLNKIILKTIADDTDPDNYDSPTALIELEEVSDFSINLEEFSSYDFPDLLKDIALALNKSDQDNDIYQVYLENYEWLGLFIGTIDSITAKLEKFKTITLRDRALKKLTPAERKILGLTTV